MFRFVLLAFIGIAAAFGPAAPRIVRQKVQVEMSLANKVELAIQIHHIGLICISFTLDQRGCCCWHACLLPCCIC